MKSKKPVRKYLSENRGRTISVVFFVNRKLKGKPLYIRVLMNNKLQMFKAYTDREDHAFEILMMLMKTETLKNSSQIQKAYTTLWENFIRKKASQYLLPVNTNAPTTTN